MRVTFAITGAVAVHGTTTTLMPTNQNGGFPASCADYAKGSTDSAGTPRIQLPSVAGSGPVDGHEVLFTNQIRDYHGPGH